MAKKFDAYDYIADKVNGLKTQYPSLRTRTDDYVFSALCVKANFYKNPALVLNDNDFAEMIVDGSNDGGVDILLSDPNSEADDLVIGQSKFYQTISSEQVLNAVRKMADFYNDMKVGHYERFNDHVRNRFRKLYDEIGDESKIHFVFYTSAPKNRIDIRRIKNKFLDMLHDQTAADLEIFFADDVVDDIKESFLRKPIVERGKIQIDEANNYLEYGDNAVIVNVSAWSIKDLYEDHNIVLLSRNLRYHIKGKAAGLDIDRAIKNTIENEPESFWLKNNGITIICDDFEIDGCFVKLWNFSIVNGGQTTYQLHRSNHITKQQFFWLPCKIIKNVGKTENEKNTFSLSIAQAANSQKPIQPSDLKANAPEQIRFAQAMKDVGILYKIKRGEEIDKNYREPYLNTNLPEVGKLCLAAIFQEPCKSRNNPSASYKELKYYAPIFKDNPEQIAALCKELLYIDCYFRKKFQPKYEAEQKDKPNADNIIPFANKARTICIAFTALAARYHQGNITDKDVTALINSPTDSDVYKMLRDLGSMKFLLPIKLYTDAYDAALKTLFRAIIKAGTKNFSQERKRNSNLTANSFLQNDRNYYDILKEHWEDLSEKINEVFADA